jgi:hypothetical protein
MHLGVSGKVVASVEPQAVQLVPLLGAFELVFLFGGTVYGVSDGGYRKLIISAARITLFDVGGGKYDLGVARGDAKIVLRQNDHACGVQFSLKVLLQPHQINLVENVRAGGDLRFSLRFFARGNIGDGDAGDQDEQGDLSVDVPVAESAWAAQMTMSAADMILLFEVRLPAGLDGALAHPAARHLLKAHKLYGSGNWRECVSECRQFAEELGGEKLAPALNQFGSDRRAMTKDERTALLVSALQHYGHIAAHSESRGGDLDYTRAEASLALQISASLASYYFRRQD